jgi:HEAT repeat protein
MKPIPAAVAATHGKQAERADLEKKLVEAFESASSPAARDYLVRQLMLVGSAVSVGALAKLLLDPERSHMGRFALERIHAPEAGDALRTALGSAAKEQQIGIVSSLGARGEEASVPVLAALLDNADEAIATAAALALGAIGTAAAGNAIAAVQASDGAGPAVADASLSCAEGMIMEGKQADALAIYKRFAGDDQPKHVKLAATRGMLAAAGNSQ